MPGNRAHPITNRRHVALLLALLLPFSFFSRAAFIPAELPADLGAPPGSVFGHVTVPVRHARPGGDTIRVAVLILKAKAARPAADPVFFFVGGPGSAATGFAGIPVFSALTASRDVVLVDPRGCGRSGPNLFFRRHGATPAQNARLNRRWFRAHHIDVPAFNASEMARDYETVRLALGYGRINGLANSFGTFVGQEYLRRFPASLRSLVMTGNLAATTDLFATAMSTQARGLHAFLDDVRRDPAARRDFPGFNRRFWGLIRELNARPRHLALADEEGPYRRVVTGDVFLSQVRNMLITTPRIPLVPLLVKSFERHRRDAIVQDSFGRLALDPRDDPDGEYNSVIAAAYARPDFERVGARALGRLSNRTLAETTGPDFLAGNRFLALWGVRYAPGTTRALPRGDVPALLLNGEFDTQTPPADGALIAARLTHATNYTYPRTGHGVGFFGGPDMAAVIAFIEDPSTPPAYATGNLRRRHFYRVSYP